MALPGISLGGFQWGTVDGKLATPEQLGDDRLGSQPGQGPAQLGPLVSFTGTFKGNGFNGIFRPTNSRDNPHKTDNKVNNVLLLNLTQEQLAFSGPIGGIPNRGSGKQAGQRINGVPYVQTVFDVTNKDTGLPDGKPIGIHFEPGVWLYVPASGESPVEGASLVRMGSIPHGVTINAQALESMHPPNAGPPIFDPKKPVALQPTDVATSAQVTEASLDVDTPCKSRIPEDLGPFVVETQGNTNEEITASGYIQKKYLDDAHQVLADANADLKIINTLTYQVFSWPQDHDPLVGGGTANISFLEGTGATAQADGTLLTPNANAFAQKLKATFWISTVNYEISVSPTDPDYAPFVDGSISPPLLRQPPPPMDSNGIINNFAVMPTFAVQLSPLGPLKETKCFTVSATQIQYSQCVILEFDGTYFPHVSVATLVPADPIPVTIPA